MCIFHKETWISDWKKSAMSSTALYVILCTVFYLDIQTLFILHNSICNGDFDLTRNTFSDYEILLYCRKFK